MANKVVSKFKEDPKLPVTKKAMWFGIGSFVWAFVVVNVPYWITMYYRDIKGKEVPISPWIGLSLIFVELILAIVALNFGMKGYKQGERSWVLWIGLVPAILVALFFVIFIVGEFVFPH